MKVLQKSITILLGGIVMGALLLTLVYMLPMSEESTNAAVSMEILDTEGWYPALPLIDSFTGTITQFNAGGILDNYTDSIMIAAASKDPGHRPLYQAMKMENSVTVTGYSYYWHGYVTILRPLLMVADYGEIRVLNEMFQLAIVILLFCMIKQRKGIVWAMLSLSVYGLLYPMALAFSLQYSWVFYITMMVSIVMLRFEETWRRNNNILLLFLVSGMLTSYMDLLTYPLITWGIPMMWWIALDDDANAEISRLKTVVLCGLFWILGYGGMWAGKWFLGEVLLREPVVTTAWNEVLYRAGAVTGTEGSEASHWQTILRNFMQCDNIQYIFILLLWFAWFVYRMFKKKGGLHTAKSPSFLLIALSSFVWYIVLHNHTFVHASFTYRIFIVFFAAVLAGVISALEMDGTASLAVPAVKWQHLISVAVMAAALLIAVTERQSVLRHNGEIVSMQMELGDGECVTQEFAPVYDTIESLHLGIGAEGEMKGQFVVKVCQGENVLTEKQIPAAEVGSKGFYEIPLNIKLSKGNRYSIQFYISESKNTKGWISVTPEGCYELTEFAAVTINDRSHDGQMIGGLTYDIMANKSKVLVNFLTLAFGLEVLALCILEVVRDCKDGMKKRKNCT